MVSAMPACQLTLLLLLLLLVSSILSISLHSTLTQSGEECFYDADVAALSPCYVVQAEDRTWEEAYFHCTASSGVMADTAGGVMAQTRTEHSMELLQQVMEERGMTRAWIGAFKQILPDWQWQAEDTTGVGAYSAWLAGHPLPVPNNSECVAMVKDNFLWQDKACSYRLGYVCHTERSSNRCSVAGSRYDEVLVHGDWCYAIMSQEVSWFVAQQACKMDGMQLATIHSASVQQMIVDARPGSGHLVNGFWIGLNRARWVWLDLTPVSSPHWQRDRQSGDGACVSYERFASSVYKWNDDVCTDHLPSICTFDRRKQSTTTPSELTTATAKPPTSITVSTTTTTKPTTTTTKPTTTTTTTKPTTPTKPTTTPTKPTTTSTKPTTTTTKSTTTSKPTTATTKPTITTSTTKPTITTTTTNPTTTATKPTTTTTKPATTTTIQDTPQPRPPSTTEVTTTTTAHETSTTTSETTTANMPETPRPLTSSPLSLTEPNTAITDQTTTTLIPETPPPLPPLTSTTTEPTTTITKSTTTSTTTTIIEITSATASTAELTSAVGETTAMIPATTTAASMGLCIPLDLAFVLDASHSLGEANWTRLKNFVMSVIREFTLSPSCVQTAVVSYSSDVDIPIHLHDHHEYPPIAELLDGLAWKEGNTNTPDALKVLRTEVFAKLNGDRPNAPNVAILLTDGRTSQDFYPDRTIPEAEEAQDEGVTMIGFGLGATISVNELQGIVTSDQYLFLVDTYTLLPLFKDALMGLIASVQLVTVSPLMSTTTTSPFVPTTTSSASSSPDASSPLITTTTIIKPSTPTTTTTTTMKSPSTTTTTTTSPSSTSSQITTTSASITIPPTSTPTTTTSLLSKATTTPTTGTSASVSDEPNTATAPGTDNQNTSSTPVMKAAANPVSPEIAGAMLTTIAVVSVSVFLILLVIIVITAVIIRRRRTRSSSTDDREHLSANNTAPSPNSTITKAKKKKNNSKKRNRNSLSSVTTPWGTLIRGRRSRLAPPKPQTNTLFYNSWGIPAASHVVDPVHTSKVDNRDVAEEQAGQAAKIEAAKVRRYQKNKRIERHGLVFDEHSNPIEPTGMHVTSSSVNEHVSGSNDGISAPPHPPPVSVSTPHPPRVSISAPIVCEQAAVENDSTLEVQSCALAPASASGPAQAMHVAVDIAGTDSSSAQGTLMDKDDDDDDGSMPGASSMLPLHQPPAAAVPSHAAVPSPAAGPALHSQQLHYPFWQNAPQSSAAGDTSSRPQSYHHQRANQSQDAPTQPPTFLSAGPTSMSSSSPPTEPTPPTGPTSHHGPTYPGTATASPPVPPPPPPIPPSTLSRAAMEASAEMADEQSDLADASSMTALVS